MEVENEKQSQGQDSAQENADQVKSSSNFELTLDKISDLESQVADFDKIKESFRQRNDKQEEEIQSLRSDKSRLENQLNNLGPASPLKTALEALASQDRPDNEKIHLRRAINTFEG